MKKLNMMGMGRMPALAMNVDLIGSECRSKAIVVRSIWKGALSAVVVGLIASSSVASAIASEASTKEDVEQLKDDRDDAKDAVKRSEKREKELERLVKRLERAEEKGQTKVSCDDPCRPREAVTNELGEIVTPASACSEGDIKALGIRLNRYSSACVQAFEASFEAETVLSDSCQVAIDGCELVRLEIARADLDEAEDVSREARRELNRVEGELELAKRMCATCNTAFGGGAYVGLGSSVGIMGLGSGGYWGPQGYVAAAPAAGYLAAAPFIGSPYSMGGYPMGAGAYMGSGVPFYPMGLNPMAGAGGGLYLGGGMPGVPMLPGLGAGAYLGAGMPSYGMGYNPMLGGGAGLYLGGGVPGVPMGSGLGAGVYLGGGMPGVGPGYNPMLMGMNPMSGAYGFNPMAGAGAGLYLGGGMPGLGMGGYGTSPYAGAGNGFGGGYPTYGYAGGFPGAGFGGGFPGYGVGSGMTGGGGMYGTGTSGWSSQYQAYMQAQMMAQYQQATSMMNLQVAQKNMSVFGSGMVM